MYLFLKCVLVGKPSCKSSSYYNPWRLHEAQKWKPQYLSQQVSLTVGVPFYETIYTNSVHLNINRESAIQEVMAGLKEYFNVTLGSLLLYKFERMQYADVILFFFSKF